MEQHRDVFRVLHPTLQAWLDRFDSDCLRFSGATYIYNSLVMLGIRRPNKPLCDALNHSCCSHDYPQTGCDCLTTIAEARQDILDSVEHIRLCPESKERKLEYMCECSRTIDLYTMMHETHADFNRRVHFLLRNAPAFGGRAASDLIAKMRAVCLRDLRNQAAGKSHIAAEASYGRELATFLVSEPKGWW